MLGVWSECDSTIHYRSIEYPAVLEVLLRQYSSQSLQSDFSLKRYSTPTFTLSIDYGTKIDAQRAVSHSPLHINMNKLDRTGRFDRPSSTSSTRRIHHACLRRGRNC